MDPARLPDPGLLSTGITKTENTLLAESMQADFVDSSKNT